eukprot:gene17619-21550_t
MRILVLGGTAFQRNRDEEFSLRDVPRAALFAQIAETDATLRAVLPALSDAQVLRPFPEPIRDHHLTT